MNRKTFLTNLQKSMYSDEFIDRWTKLFNSEPNLIDQCFPMIDNIDKEWNRTSKLVDNENILLFTEHFIELYVSNMKKHDWPAQLIQILFLNVNEDLATKYVVNEMSKNIKTYIIQR